MNAFALLVLFLIIIGALTIAGWVRSLPKRIFNDEKPKRFDALMVHLTREGFYEYKKSQTSRRAIRNRYLSNIISSLAEDENFFETVTQSELEIIDNPDDDGYRYRLCSDYACIGFNIGVTKANRDVK